ncbi:MAG TPA: hypothetical protein VMS98_13375 [Thermoanaerobaculia bacterium]|nr:hypothetical protein [Thermoanaerobaculia bacterium]
MLIVLTALAFLFLGRELSLRWWRDEPLPFYERATCAAVIGLTIWLASLWALALLHLMTRWALLGRTAVVLIIAIVLFARRRRVAMPADWREKALWLVVVPWVIFMAWRGWLLPPVNHDALAYHLPKAVLFERAAGWDRLGYLDARIASIPANYEMLLAESVAIDRRDTLTEWFSTLFYVLFAFAAGAIAERWWKSRATLAAVFAAGVPVALLHSGTHKNDLMTAFFIIAGLVAAGRFVTTSDRRALLLTVFAFAAAVGTKPQAALVAVCVAPVILWRAEKRQVGVALVAGVAAFLLLGGAVYVSNLVTAAQPAGADVIQYGDWANLWQAPYVLLAGPFAPSAYELPVPWESRPWFWRRYEVFFSHLGIPFALCAIAAPFAAFALRRRATSEAAVITIAALAAFAIMLPVKFEPHGLYAISLPRYALFIVPVVFGWTIAVLPPRAARAAAGLAVISFCAYAVDVARNDVFAPLAYVQWAHEHRGTRVVPFDPYRAASVADRRAGPRDRIAIDAAFGSWIHPAFGAQLSRPVDFIPPGDGPPLIREDADWVIIDRAWDMIWEHPDFRDLSQARDFLVRGSTAPADERTMRYLRDDSRFRLVFYNPKTYQAVFQRVR